MWRHKQSASASDSDADDPYEYIFRIYRWDGSNGSLASQYNRSAMDHYTHSEGWILDAMTINVEEGTLIYKATPRDVNSKSRVGVLEVRDGLLSSVKDVPISPDTSRDVAEHALCAVMRSDSTPLRMPRLVALTT